MTLNQGKFLKQTNKQTNKQTKFPRGPVFKTALHCRGRGFDPWSGSEDPTCRMV